MSFIQNLFTSRDNNANAETYVGQQDRIWWNPITNSLYYSDGSTPGGIPIGAGGNPFNQLLNTYNDVTFANVTVTGNLNADLGNISNIANISVLNTANLGNLTIYDQTISGTISGRDITIATIGDANIEIVGQLHVHSSGDVESTPDFQIAPDGQVTILVPALDTNAGAVEIVGSTSGAIVPLGNPGGMLHVTGQNNEVSRIYNDGINNYPLYVGRRVNGTALAPTGVLGGQVISRLGANPYLGDAANFAGLGTARIDFIATENQTTTNQGSRIVMNVTPTGSNVQATVASFDTNGILLTGNLIPLTDNIYSLGNVTYRWIGAYFGNAGIYIQDTTLGNDAQLSVDNGSFLIDGAQRIQIGNMQMTTDGISLVTANTGSNIQIGASGDTGYMQLNMPGIVFSDDTIQTTAAIPVTEKGIAFGVVPLNGATKIDPVYLPAGGISFQGVWNANTNTPTLADGVGTVGDEWIVGTAGTQDLGSGNITFAVGDFVLYTSSNVWVDVPVGGTGVSSFNSRTGAVTLTSGDVTNALSNSSIVNSKLVSSSMTINTGAGLNGGQTIDLGGSMTLTADVANIVAGTGVTVTPSAGTYTIAIGQPVGTSNTVQFGAITSTTTIQATGNVTGGNIATGGRVVAIGNIVTQANLVTPNTVINSGVSTTGNVTGSYIIGNGSLLTGLNAYGNVYANGTAMLAGNGSATLTVTPGNNQVITGNNTSKVLTIAVNDNPTFTNVSVTGNITISGNINTANTTYLSNVGNILFANTAPLPTAQPGVMEYDGRVLYFTPQDQERGIVPNQEWYVLNSDRGLTYASTTPQSLFGVGAHVSNSTRYWFRLKATISRSAGTNNTALTLGWRGSAVLSKLNYTAQASIGAVSTPTSSTTFETTLVAGFTVQTAVTGTNNPPDSTTLVIQGMIDVGATGAGYVEPFVSWTGAVAPGSVTVSSLSYFQLFPVGVTGANTDVGNWA